METKIRWIAVTVVIYLFCIGLSLKAFGFDLIYPESNIEAIHGVEVWDEYGFMMADQAQAIDAFMNGNLNEYQKGQLISMIWTNERCKTNKYRCLIQDRNANRFYYGDDDDWFMSYIQQ